MLYTWPVSIKEERFVYPIMKQSEAGNHGMSSCEAALYTAKKPTTPTTAAHPRPASWVRLPALEPVPLLLVDEADELLLEPVAVALELVLELELEVPLALTASQISITVFCVAVFSVSNDTLYAHGSWCKGKLTADVRDRARGGDASGGVGSDSILLLALAGKVSGAAAYAGGTVH